MAEELLPGNYIQADETPVGVQSERVPGKNHQAYRANRRKIPKAVLLAAVYNMCLIF